MTNERQEAFEKVKDAVAEAKKKGLSDEAISRQPRREKRKQAEESLILGRAL